MPREPRCRGSRRGGRSITPVRRTPDNDETSSLRWELQLTQRVTPSTLDEVASPGLRHQRNLGRVPWNAERSEAFRAIAGSFLSRLAR